MKATRFTLTDSEGKRFTWTLRYFPQVFHCGGNLEIAYVGPEWMLTRHDGVESGVGRNWLDAVPLVQLIASNYGLTTSLS